MNQFVNTCL